MATEFCQKCKQSHPGRVCDYDEKGECAETIESEESEKEAFGRGPIAGSETVGGPGRK